MTVNVPALPGFLHQVQVVSARQKTHVVDLGRAGGEKLDGPGHDVGIIIFPQGGVVGAVYLVDIQILVFRGGILFLHVGSPAVELLHGEIGLLLGEQIRRIHHPDAVVGVQGGKLVAGTDAEPVLQGRKVLAVPGVEKKQGQGEIIDGETPAGHLLLNGVVLVHLRQKVNMKFAGDFFQLLQDLPDLRFHHKTGGAPLFCDISHRI